MGLSDQPFEVMCPDCGAMLKIDPVTRAIIAHKSAPKKKMFEDFGEAKLVRGKARVKISADFAAIVDTKDYYVFLTPHGDSAGLFVTARTFAGFEVREQGRGTSSLSFAYRIVAHPRQASDNKRLAKIKLPPLPRARG